MLIDHRTRVPLLANPILVDILLVASQVHADGLPDDPSSWASLFSRPLAVSFIIINRHRRRR